MGMYVLTLILYFIGVQVFKAISPTPSISNKDSKESFTSNEMAQIMDDTKSWVNSQNNDLALSQTDLYLNKIFEESLQPEENETMAKQEDKEQDQVQLEEDVSKLQNFIGKRSHSLFSNDSSDFGRNGDMLLDSINTLGTEGGNLIDRSIDFKEANSTGQQLVSKGQGLPDFKVNGVPSSNQITCSVEVHREKSVTPASIAEWLDNTLSQSTSLRKRKESVVSIPQDKKYFESSV